MENCIDLFCRGFKGKKKGTPCQGDPKSQVSIDISVYHKSGLPAESFGNRGPSAGVSHADSGQQFASLELKK